jgi:hypothetical protein
MGRGFLNRLVTGELFVDAGHLILHGPTAFRPQYGWGGGGANIPSDNIGRGAKEFCLKYFENKVDMTVCLDDNTNKSVGNVFVGNESVGYLWSGSRRMDRKMKMGVGKVVTGEWFWDREQGKGVACPKDR